MAKIGFRFFAVAFVLSSPVVLAGQEPRSPYAGEETREIKALSAQQIAAYEAGEGMGYARAAELNHYPGPRHVLELEKELALTAAQAAGIREIHRRMRDEAVRLGKAILEKERGLDRLFAETRITPESLARATEELARLEGRLRATHLKAHLETRALLTREQIAAYDGLRGYGKGGHAGHHGGGN